MVKKILGVTILLAVLGAGIWYYAFYNSDEALIKRKVISLEKLLTKELNEGNIAEAIKIQEISSIPAESCEIKNIHKLIDRIYTPADFASTVLRVHSLCSVLEVDFDNAEVTITTPDTALVTLEAEAKATLKSGEKEEVNSDVTLTFKKTEKGWKITKISAQNLLK